jgi:hypothetical protein
MLGWRIGRMQINARTTGSPARCVFVASGATVLFLTSWLFAGGLREDNGETHVRVFEFRCEVQTPMGQGYLDGLMASDGHQHRISIYWIEPRVFREALGFLRYSDFIFRPETVDYWLYGVPQPGRFEWSVYPEVPLLPQDNSVESVARSVLAIVGRIGSRGESAELPLEAGRFFQASREETEYSYEAMPREIDNNDVSDRHGSEVRTPDALRYGHKYSKRMQDNESMVWSMEKGMNGPPIATVTIKAVRHAQGNGHHALFDPNTLGQWELVPQCCRIYWSFDREYCELNRSPNICTSSRALCDRIESHLDENSASTLVCAALEYLRFKTALMTDDADRVRRSAEACVTTLCQDDSLDTYESLVQLGAIAGQMEEKYPAEAVDWLRPLVRQMVQHTGHDTLRNVERLMTRVAGNRWFTYGRLLIEELRTQDPADDPTLDSVSRKLEAAYTARTSRPPDPCEPSLSVKYYMAHLDEAPPKGTADMNDLRDILEQGLAKVYAEDDSEMKRKVVENTIRSIRLIAGEGPFRVRADQLTQSIARFSESYIVVNKTVEPIDTVLATFLALSFCDISTAEDHDLLLSQFRKCSAGLQSQVNDLLQERELGSLIASEDVEHVFVVYERLFHEYIEDPLWPTFKFPWTTNEEARIAATLRLRVMQLEPLLDEMSLRVKHGGTSENLKKETLYEISCAAQELLPRAASRRTPPYPGISCQYRGGGHGFMAVIEGPLYDENGRPKEKFKAMKYFHLGHRLQEVVEREREFTRPNEGTHR